MVEELKKEMSQSEIGKLAVEIRKLEKRLKKIDNLSDEDVKATSFLLNRMYKIIEGYDIQLVDYTGQKFLEGMAGIDILSAETDKDLDFPIIGETMTPLVVIGGKINQRSKVVIKTPENVVEETHPGENNKQLSDKQLKLNLIIRMVELFVVLLGLIGIIWFFCGKFLSGTNSEVLDEENVVEEVVDENDIMDNTPEIEYVDENLEESEDNEINQDESNIEENVGDEVNNEIQEDENIEEQGIEEGSEDVE